MANVLKKWVESDTRELKRLSKIADKVGSYAEEYRQLSDEELQAKTPALKERYQKGETLDDLLPEAFAVAREGAKRVLGLYPFHVQIMGGIVLHEGNIAEMKTGEGKTLTATMPVYLNALAGKGVHVVTVNEYLSQRDATEMGELYNWLGLTVGLTRPKKMPMRSVKLTLPTSLIQPTAKSGLIICVTTWLPTKSKWSNGHLTLRSSMKLTPS